MVTEPMPGLAVWLAVVLVCLSTLAGAWLARRASRQVTAWLAVASALMLVTALIDMLPDAWQGAVESGVPLWAVGAAILSGFLVITYFTRKGCGHGHDEPAAATGRHAPGLHRRVKEVIGAAVFSGVGTAAALAVHRAVEGATLALTTSAVVVIALMVHSTSEGLALTALLDMASRRPAPWLVVSCVSPVAGVLIATVSPLPARAEPILVGVVAGVLLRTALVGLKLAAIRQEDGRLPRRHVLSAIGVAGTMAVLLAAVHLVPEHPAVLSAGAGHRLPAPAGPAPVPAPSATPTATSEPEDSEQLRAALAAGELSLAQVLERDDKAAKRTCVAWLLRGLPGYRSGDIRRLLEAQDISPTRTIGELTRRQRDYLVEHISTDQ
ncbi:hypothetical protein Aph01nite_21590 [Acrocarpospora phusangensis]|uniref:Zinc transporter ZupT n=1 Tax=Acrocarpospora phusangensis TaxID=1070424 RepID=A0A919Q7G5_9ACTN|nr:hypothetical protein [Acrocarpospora phusangensis]GIH23849.1 hypothetical protein Aph01nite_21590 [Acrocarpospora phusangensis]